MREADRLAREIVMQRDVECRCGPFWQERGTECKGPMQWCHVHSRSYHAIRHDPRNAIAMCAAHHAYFTHHPLQWETWCREHGIPWGDLRLDAIEGAATWSLAETLERLATSQQEGAKK